MYPTRRVSDLFVALSLLRRAGWSVGLVGGSRGYNADACKGNAVRLPVAVP